MKTIKYIFISIIFITGLTFSQENQTDTITAISNPSAFINKILFQFDEFDFYRELYHLNIQVPLDKDKNTIQLRTEMIIRQSSGNNYNTEERDYYFLSPLYNKYIEE